MIIRIILLFTFSSYAFAESPQLFADTVDTFDKYLSQHRTFDKFWLSDEEAKLAYEHVRNKDQLEQENPGCETNFDAIDLQKQKEKKCKGEPGEVQFAIRVSSSDLKAALDEGSSYFSGCELGADGESCEDYYQDFLAQDYDSSKSTAENLAALKEKLKEGGYADDKELDYFFKRRLSLSYILNPDIKGDDKLSAISTISDSWSVEQKVELLQLMGKYLVSDYNYDRAGIEGTKNDEPAVISCDTMFGNITNGQSGDGGICRDITYCVGKLAISMGLPAYGVSFATVGGFHATLLTYNPDNPNEVYKLNYNELLSEKNKEGIEALSQDNTLPQMGTHYRIYDIADGGKVVSSLPTELGLFMDLESGAGVNDIDPFFNPHYSVASMKVGKGDCQYNVSAGKLTNGDVVLFLSKSFPINKNGKFTIGANTLVHDTEYFENPILAQTLYLALSQNFYTPSLKLKNYELRGTAGLRGAAMVGIVVNQGVNPLVDGNLDTNIGAELEKTKGKDKFRASVNSQYGFGIKDMRNNQFSDVSNYRAVNNGVFFEVAYGKELPGDVTVAFDGALAIRAIGNSAAAKASISTKKTEVYTGVSGGFSGKQTPFMPGGFGQTLFLGVNTKASALPLMHNMDALVFQLRHEKNLDKNDQTPALSTVGIKLVPPKPPKN